MELKDRYFKLIEAHSDRGRDLWFEIEDAYSKKSRFYHNLSHLTTMFELRDAYQSALNNPIAIDFAIFYHDLIYNVRKPDNEERSAEIAKIRMSNMSMDPSVIALCQDLILATKQHLQSANNDINYFLDFDLSILGADSETYMQYAANIRKEYDIFPTSLYRPERKKVLKAFLNQNQIFNTREFQDKFEEQARKNINWEIDDLTP